jgi:hypothetical protein
MTFWNRANAFILVGVTAYVILGVALVTIYGNAALIVSLMASIALVFVTAVLVKATFAYTEVTNRQASAMNRQVAALTNAVVFFGIEEFESSMVLQFFVQNVGPGIAYDVNFKVIKDSEAAILVDDKKLSGLAFIKNPLKTLAPGQKIPFAVIDSQKDLLTENIEVEVSYKNQSDATEPFKQRFLIDFAYTEGMRQVRPPSIADNVKRIADNVNKIADSSAMKK